MWKYMRSVAEHTKKFTCGTKRDLGSGSPGYATRRLASTHNTDDVIRNAMALVSWGEGASRVTGARGCAHKHSRTDARGHGRSGLARNASRSPDHAHCMAPSSQSGIWLAVGRPDSAALLWVHMKHVPSTAVSLPAQPSHLLMRSAKQLARGKLGDCFPDHLSKKAHHLHFTEPSFPVSYENILLQNYSLIHSINTVWLNVKVLHAVKYIKKVNINK